MVVSHSCNSITSALHIWDYPILKVSYRRVGKRNNILLNLSTLQIVLAGILVANSWSTFDGFIPFCSSSVYKGCFKIKIWKWFFVMQHPLLYPQTRKSNTGDDMNSRWEGRLVEIWIKETTNTWLRFGKTSQTNIN